MKNIELVLAAIAIVFSLNAATASRPTAADDNKLMAEEMMQNLNASYPALKVKCISGLGTARVVDELQGLQMHLEGREVLAPRSLIDIACKHAVCLREPGEDQQ